VKTVQEALVARFRLLVAATVILYFALIGLGIYGYTTRSSDLARINEIAIENQTALCLFRENIEKQVEGSEQFLEDNPDGIPGLSAEAIQASIDRQKATLEALDILEC